MNHRFIKSVFLCLLVSVVWSQQPIIRVKQLGQYKTPEFWWRDKVTHNLSTYLADDTNNPACKNNNFDAWRDRVLTMEVTLDDNGADISTFRLDFIFDNDLITWNHADTKVLKGSHLSAATEGDSTLGADYSYEVVHYSNVGYVDSLQNDDSEISETNNRYDWLRITAVSHNVNNFEFGGGNGVQKQLLKLHFKINDVVDNFQPQSFRVATLFSGNSGYYTYVSDDYLLDYKVYIDGNWGTESTYNGGARGDITLHPKLLDVEGYLRYVARNGTNNDKTYPYWKVKFELDQSNPNNYANWYNIEGVDNTANNVDEDNSDDVIGDNSSTFYYNKKGTTQEQALPNEGFLGISYYDSTYTDDRGYFNIELPRNNYYRMSFWPPDAADDIETHTQLELDRYAITNINDAIASFNFQSNKFYSVGGVDTLNAVGYLIGDVDGDDLFQLNDTYFLWAYVSQIFDNYTHKNGNSYENWATIDTLKENGNWLNYQWYESLGNQKYEFTVFKDTSLNQENATLNFGKIEVTNPLMNTIQTGLDTIAVTIGAGSSTYGNDDNPDYTLDSLSYFFTGDINVTGTKVQENGGDGYIDINGSTFYRWGGGNAPNTWLARMLVNQADVSLSFPPDSTVRVQSGDQIEVPLTITPNNVNVAGFEFEIEYKVDELEFIDMKTDVLPGPWMTYVNVHEPIDGWQRVSFGGLDYSPGNAPETYWIDEEMVGLKLIFKADFPDAEWTEAPIKFVGKHAAGNPSGKDLLVDRIDGKVMVWNKFWAFGGGQPDDADLTYNWPNPFTNNTIFQFYLGKKEKVKLYILNSMGQYKGTLLNEEIGEGIHTFSFTNEPTVFLPEVSNYENHMKLEPGVYIFVLQTESRIKSNKFTVIK